MTKPKISPKKRRVFDTFATLFIIALVAASCISNRDAKAQGVSATISWTAVVLDVQGNSISKVTYNVYQGTKDGSRVRVASGLPGTSFIAENLPAGEVCFHVTANNSQNGESLPSNVACKTSYPRTSAPVITIK